MGAFTYVTLIMYYVAFYDLDQQEEYLTLGLQPRLVEAVSHHIQNVRQQPDMILGVEGVHNGLIGINIGQNVLQQVKAQITICAQLVSQ